MRGIKTELGAVLTRERLRRLGAFAVDLAVVALILSLCTLLFQKPDFAQAQREMDAIIDIMDVEARQAQTQTAVAAFSRAYGMAVIVWLGYEVLTQLLFGGQTLGKKLCGLRVVSTRAADGRLKTTARMTVRSLVKGLCLILFQGFPILISWFYILSNPGNRAGYDLFLGTRVVPCQS